MSLTVRHSKTDQGGKGRGDEYGTMRANDLLTRWSPGANINAGRRQGLSKAGTAMRRIEKGMLEELLAEVGAKLAVPATICVVGSAAAILLGQPERQTPDIDIWAPESDFDTMALRCACEAVGLLFDPRGELRPDEIYLQILRPGITMFPEHFAVEKLGRFGNLTVVMPPPELIVATKLARADERDIEDAAWWVRVRNLSVERIDQAIRFIPQAENQVAARENLIFVQLTSRTKP